MFALRRHLFRVCDKLIIREMRHRRPIPGANPGLNARLQVFRKDGIKIDDEDAEEFIEQSDSSFYDVGESYGEHVKETLIGKHELRHKIVKEKYFKENMPNLLTWSEKEQIRHLATTMPDEWTPERVAESFPVTEAVVKKLLKFPWKPATEDRIARHDASAMRNWKELKEGTLDIPEKIRQHFLKFSERTIPPLNKASLKVDLTQEEKMGEFESIIRRCASSEASKSNKTEDASKEEVDGKLKRHKRDTKTLTLHELANTIKCRLEQGQNVDMPDKMIADSVTYKPEPKVKRDIELYNTADNELTGIREDRNKLEVLSSVNYPERIRIPKKSYKKDATYKVNDCFYDHDGRFLYRVIGLTGNK